MKIAAIAYVSFFENEVKQRILEVEDNATWKDVLILCADLIIPEGVDSDPGCCEWLLNLDDDLDKAREDLSDADMDLAISFFEK